MIDEELSWNKHEDYNIKSISGGLQDRTIKNCYSFEKRTKILYEKYPSLPIEKIIKQQLCMMVYKIVNDLLTSKIKFKGNET